MRQVFLDHLSTTPLLPEAWEAMKPFFTEHFGAPASLHHHGLRAREAMARSRAQFAGMIQAESPEEIIFTSGGTESANLAVKGTAMAQQRRGNHIVVSETEHLSVLNSVVSLEKQGFVCTRVKVDGEGMVNPEGVRAALTEQTILICVHHVNHELGTIEPIREIGQLAGERGITFFVDATASGGWLPIDVQGMGASLLSLSPHRFYGPKGVGVLYRNRRARLSGIQHGGGQEEGHRAGTENVPGIVGAGVAAEVALRELPERMARTARLQERLWRGLAARIPHIQLNGPELGPRRMSTNVNVSTEFIEGEGQLLLCDMQGIAVSSGPSCISKALKVSHVLRAIGLDLGLAQGNLVMSLGKDNTEEEMDYVVETFEKIVKKLRGMSPLWDEFQRGKIQSAIHPDKTQRAGKPGHKRE
ncbi:MAG: iscS [Pedosphaera sp.]|nr:iscS [Pedosphaera sp.]